MALCSMYHRLCETVSMGSNRIFSGVSLPKNRFGSPISYVFAALRGPKLTSLRIDEMKVHASKQLPGLMSVPSFSLQLISQSLGRGGRTSRGLKEPDIVEALKIEVFILFADCDGSSDGRYDIVALGSLIGNAMVPSRSRAKASERLDKRESSTGCEEPFGNAKSVLESESADLMG